MTLLQWGGGSGERGGTDEKKCSRVSLVVVVARPLTRTTCALVVVVVDELVEARGEVVVCQPSDDDVARETKGMAYTVSERYTPDF